MLTSVRPRDLAGKTRRRIAAEELAELTARNRHGGLRHAEPRHSAHLDLAGDASSRPPRPPTIQVWRSVRESADTKTKRSRRTLRLPGVAVEALTRHKREQDRRREAAVTP
jgi:hypothetical protein